MKSVFMVCYCWLYGDSRAVHRERVSHYLEYEKEFNLQGISFPMALKDIPKFKKANNVSISVNGYQEGKEGQEGFEYLLKVFLLLLMIRSTIVSSKTLVSWWDRSIRVVVIKRISADSACMDSQELKIEVTEGRIKK